MGDFNLSRLDLVTKKDFIDGFSTEKIDDKTYV